MNKKSAKFLNLFFPFSILVAIVASIMIGNLVSTLENWAYRNWVNLFIFILMILFGLILIILVPLGFYSYSSKKLGIKIKNLRYLFRINHNRSSYIFFQGQYSKSYFDGG